MRSAPSIRSACPESTAAEARSGVEHVQRRAPLLVLKSVSARSTQAPTLQEVLAQLPALGARRLVLIALQLATELDLAEQSGVAHEPMSTTTVRLERAGTPFEQALLTSASGPRRAAGLAEGDLSELGALLRQLLASRPLYLEGSIRAGAGKGNLMLSRRADAGVLASLRQAMTLIVHKCESAAPGTRYDSAFDVAQDLAKLAAITERIVIGRRRALEPRVGLMHPQPRAAVSIERLPKVIVKDHPARLVPSDARGFRNWAAALGPSHSLAPWASRLQLSLARL
jgi:hypothetical protein